MRTERRYISAVNYYGEPIGPSHIVTGSKGAQPTVACYTNTLNMNWTQNPTPKTEVCKNCKKIMERKNQ